MIYELDAYVNGSLTKFFMRQFCFDAATVVCPIHCHKYAEIHMIIDGTADFLFETQKSVYGSGDIFILPAEMYHCCTRSDAQTRHLAFQVAVNVEKPVIGHLSEHIIAELINALSRVQKPSGSAALSALLSYTCCGLITDSIEQPRIMTDIAATIYEFVSQNYNRNIKISDLADTLHFSAKQTERLVKKYTGTTFKNILTKRRLMIAEFLEQNTDMSGDEIAAYVGYANYSGLWKAKQRDSAMPSPVHK